MRWLLSLKEKFNVLRVDKYVELAAEFKHDVWIGLVWYIFVVKPINNFTSFREVYKVNS